MKKSSLLVASGCIVLTSCSTQILTNLASTTTSSVVTTTTIPTGDIKTLLGEMLDNATGLGNLIVAGDKTGARLRLQNIEAAWTAVKPQLVALGNDVSVDVERIVGLAQNAVNKKRPADADKVVRFLPLVINALG